jgi:hypothetical protein
LALGDHSGDVQVGFAAKIPSDKGGIHASPFTNLPSGGAFETPLAEQHLGRLEQRFLTGSGVPGSIESGTLTGARS